MHMGVFPCFLHLYTGCVCEPVAEVVPHAKGSCAVHRALVFLVASALRNRVIRGLSVKSLTQTLIVVLLIWAPMGAFAQSNKNFKDSNDLLSLLISLGAQDRDRA